MAYELGIIDSRSAIKTVYNGRILETSVGRIRLNNIIPENLRFINEEMTKKELKALVAKVLETNGPSETAIFVDRNLRILVLRPRYGQERLWQSMRETMVRNRDIPNNLFVI